MCPSLDAAKQNLPLTRNIPMLAPKRESETKSDRDADKLTPGINILTRSRSGPV